MCQVRSIPFEDLTNSFWLSSGQGVYIFEGNRKSIQDVIGDVCFPGKYCLNREKCESIGGYLTNPRSIYGCGNKATFTLHEHVKTTKTDQKRFFFHKKR